MTSVDVGVRNIVDSDLPSTAPEKRETMKIEIIFGTESGGAELMAEDIADSLSDRFHTSVTNMSDIDVKELDSSALYLIVCSTYGDGGLPFSAQPFYDALSSARPDLAGLHYAVFGRGDTAYLKTYSHGSEIIDRLLTELGATRVGEYGRHDAGDWDADDAIAVEWADGVVGVIAGNLL
jgi:MioC protein